MDDWSPLDEFDSFRNDRGNLQRDVLLTGTLHVEVRGRDGSPRAGQTVIIRGCGFT